MKKYLLLFLICCLTTFNSFSQRRTRGISINKPEIKNTISKEEDSNFEVLVEEALEIYNMVKNQNLSAFTESKNFSLIKADSLYNLYISQGKSANTISSYEGFLKRDIPEFINTLAVEKLDIIYKKLKTKYQYTKSSSTIDSKKQEALNEWNILRRAAESFFNGKKIGSISNFLNKVVKETSYYETELNSKYEKYLKTDFHKGHRNKIMLSKEANVYNNEDNISFIEKVVLDNDLSLFFTFYNSLTNKDFFKLPKNNLGMTIQFNDDIGNKTLNVGCHWDPFNAYNLNQNQLSQSHLTLPLLVNAQKFDGKNENLEVLMSSMLQCLLDLSTDSFHDARLLLKFPSSKEVFTKDFKIKITESGHKRLQDLNDAVAYAKLNNVRLKSRGDLHTKAYENLVLNSAKSKGFKNVTRINITGSKYAVVKNANYPYDIKYKAIGGQFAYKYSNGKYYIAKFLIKRDYTGGGTYGKEFVSIDQSPGYGDEILFNNIKK